MDRSAEQLRKECQLRGIEVPERNSQGKKTSRYDMVRMLAEKSFSEMENKTWGMRKRLDLESPMLCFTFKHLTSLEQEKVLKSSDYICEQKQNGARIIVTYHPDEGFMFFSRNHSVDDFLPVDYTDKILLIKDGKATSPKSWKGKIKKSFILDGEAICRSINIDTTLGGSRKGTYTNSELNAVTSIMAMNPEDSQKIQVSQAPIEFVFWDILEFDGKDLKNFPLRYRKEVLNKVLNSLSKVLPFEENRWVSDEDEKEDLYQTLISQGKEGVVYKNINSPYIGTSSRRRDAMIKRKRSMNLGSDIDAYVIGFVPADKDKKWSNLIGALKMGVILKKEDGSEVEHWIASVSSMPMELREKMSEQDENGNPVLKKEFYGKVCIINGMAVTGKSLRFSHATIDWDVGFRSDKNSDQCILTEEFLKSSIM